MKQFSAPTKNPRETEMTTTKKKVTFTLSGTNLAAFKISERELEISRLRVYSKNPATRTDESAPANKKLADEIRARGAIDSAVHGVRMPDGMIELGDGNRRLAAARKLGFETMPVIEFVPRDGADPEAIVEAIFNAAEKTRMQRPMSQNVAVILCGGDVESTVAKQHVKRILWVKRYLPKEEYQRFLDGEGKVEALKHAWVAANNHYLSDRDRQLGKRVPAKLAAKIFMWAVKTKSIRGLLEHNLRWAKGNFNSGPAFFEAFESNVMLPSDHWEARTRKKSVKKAAQEDSSAAPELSN